PLSARNPAGLRKIFRPARYRCRDAGGRFRGRRAVSGAWVGGGGGRHVRPHSAPSLVPGDTRSVRRRARGRRPGAVLRRRPRGRSAALAGGAALSVGATKPGGAAGRCGPGGGAVRRALGAARSARGAGGANATGGVGGPSARPVRPHTRLSPETLAAAARRPWGWGGADSHPGRP